MNPLLLLVGLASAAAVTYLATRKSGGGAGGAPAAPPYPAARLVPQPGKAITADRIRTLGALFDHVWSDVTRRLGTMPPQAKEVALAQAAAEMTGFGQGWEMTGNVASYQCGGTEQGTAYYDCVAHIDSRPMPDGTQKQYTTTFRKYKDGATPDGKSRSALEAGAWDFLHAITVKPFPALAELLAGDVLAYARRQYGSHYYEGFNLSEAGEAAYADTIKRLVDGGVPLFGGGRQIAVSQVDGTWKQTGSVAIPDNSPTPARVAGRIALYAGSMGRALPEIAQALGHDRVHAFVPADVITFKPSYVATAGAAVAGIDHCARLVAECHAHAPANDTFACGADVGALASDALARCPRCWAEAA